MKIGFLSDAHGNPVGLACCLAFLEAARVDRLHFLGDAVGYLPNWAPVLEALRSRAIPSLLGNHDARLLEPGIATRPVDAYRFLPDYVASVQGYTQWIRTWPSVREVPVQGRRLLLVHGSPSSPTEGYVYPWTDKASFHAIDADAIFMGHTHRPFVERVGGKLVVNVGSCGLPRDHGGLASCAIYDVDADHCEVFRLPFDVEAVLASSPGLHPSVAQCLRRTTPNFVGTLVPDH